MRKRDSKSVTSTLQQVLSRETSYVSHQILRAADQSYSLREFADEATAALAHFVGCECVEARLINSRAIGYLSYLESDDPPFDIRNESRLLARETIEYGLKDFEWLCSQISEGRYDQDLPFFTPYGSFFTDDLSKTFVFSKRASGQPSGRTVKINSSFVSIAIVPFSGSGSRRDLLIAGSMRHGFFSEQSVVLLEELAQFFDIALQHHNTQVALRERVKELSCLYDIARVASNPDTPLEEVLQETVALLPPAWLYPGVACSRIVFDGESYLANDFKDFYPSQSAEIIVEGIRRGTVEVAYSEERPELDEGPFLREERSLINAVAREVSLIIEKRRIEAEKEELNEQLRHAHRLATIGQFAAGVAHELNEPLGNILGFAQLAEKQSDVPQLVQNDLQKIIKASLYGREVIRKLMLFARQTPPGKQKLDLNAVVEDSLFLFESRCASAGVALERKLESSMPSILADRSQMYQVIVNLVVNAIQAMPDGGKLKISTGLEQDQVTLAVEDTGTGIEEEILEKIFVPFFSTKDVNVGTGLGLSVVHGIVVSHGGTVSAASDVDKGSRFVVRLPIDGNGSENSGELNSDA